MQLNKRMFNSNHFEKPAWNTYISGKKWYTKLAKALGTPPHKWYYKSADNRQPDVWKQRPKSDWRRGGAVGEIMTAWVQIGGGGVVCDGGLATANHSLIRNVPANGTCREGETSLTKLQRNPVSKRWSEGGHWWSMGDTSKPVLDFLIYFHRNDSPLFTCDIFLVPTALLMYLTIKTSFFWEGWKATCYLTVRLKE